LNGWDVFTWVSCAVLAGCAVVIFALFLRDAGGILKRERRDGDED
jgi:hypothetical protein